MTRLLTLVMLSASSLMASAAELHNSYNTKSFVDIGRFTSCALFIDEGIQCFGGNYGGSLKQFMPGDHTMVENSFYNPDPWQAPPMLDFGSDFTPVYVAPVHQTICASSDQGELRCWGDDGRLHWHNVFLPSDPASKVDLGEDFHVVKIVESYRSALLLSAEGTVKVFGHLRYGGTEQFPSAWSADADLYGANNPTLDFGLPEGVYVVDIASQDEATHSCALFSNGKIKCWGMARSTDYNTGVLGEYWYVGTQQPTDYYLAQYWTRLNESNFIDLGSDFIATRIDCSQENCCAVGMEQDLKCWGSNVHGLLGIESGVEQVGRHPGTQLGDAVDRVHLPTGVKVLDLTMANSQACILSTENKMYCWGLHSHLAGWFPYELYKDIATNEGNIGDKAGHMGDNMPRLNFGDVELFRPVQLDAGYKNCYCAMSDNLRVKCWGQGYSGMIASGTKDIGKTLDTWGNNVPVVLDHSDGYVPTTTAANVMIQVRESPVNKALMAGFVVVCVLFSLLLVVLCYFAFTWQKMRARKCVNSLSPVHSGEMTHVFDDEEDDIDEDGTNTTTNNTTTRIHVQS